MTETLFPVRQRCKRCRKKLESIVLNGIHCSYRCALHPEPPATLEATPRQCKREVGGRWDYKTKFRSENEVPERLRADPGTNIYRCDNCLFLHVGHSRVKEEDKSKLRRTVYEMKTLGSVIQRRRDELNWDKKRLASDLGIRPIRITEIERGDAEIDGVALFKILARLKIVVELIER